MSRYVVLKLISGEQIMGTLIANNSLGITLMDVISVKQLPIMKEGMVSEKVITSMYCNYTDDNYFEFHHKDVIFCKNLKQSLVSHYVRLVDEFYSTSSSEESEADTEVKLDIVDSNTLH